jgi:hypothetical protein
VRRRSKCVARRRVAVSAAFFIEQEFQDTGSFVYRLYKAAFSRLPLYLEFMPDRNRVVGGADLQSSKASFVEEFVKREDFKRAYPDTLSPDEFVNRLFDAANLKPYTQERQQKITDMREGGKTRAQVLAEVIEIDEFKRREFNPAFVLPSTSAIYDATRMRTVTSSGSTCSIIVCPEIIKAWSARFFLRKSIKTGLALCAHATTANAPPVNNFVRAGRQARVMRLRKS